MNAIAIAAARKGAQPAATFKALESLVCEALGVKLFTVMEIDRAKNVARRSYTNMPDAYPAQGEKPRMRNRWSETVEERQETFVANSIEEIAEVFPDYELIRRSAGEASSTCRSSLMARFWARSIASTSPGISPPNASPLPKPSNPQARWPFWWPNVCA